MFCDLETVSALVVSKWNLMKAHVLTTTFTKAVALLVHSMGKWESWRNRWHSGRWTTTVHKFFVSLIACNTDRTAFVVFKDFFFKVRMRFSEASPRFVVMSSLQNWKRLYVKPQKSAQVAHLSFLQSIQYC